MIGGGINITLRQRVRAVDLADIRKMNNLLLFKIVSGVQNRVGDSAVLIRDLRGDGDVVADLHL